MAAMAGTPAGAHSSQFRRAGATVGDWVAINGASAINRIQVGEVLPHEGVEAYK
jgi:hypothetical protein